MGVRLPLSQGSNICQADNSNLSIPLFRRQNPICYAENDRGDDDDDDDDSDYEEGQELQLWDKESQTFLAVTVEHEIDHKNTHYYLCYPDDHPVAFARMTSADELDIIDDKDLVKKLFPNASAVMSEDQMTLHDTPFILTMTDLRTLEELDDDYLGHIADEEEDDDDDDDEEEDDDDDDDHSVEMLAEFDFEGDRYYVVRPLGPVHVVAKAVGSDVVVLGEKELEKISPIIEEFIMNQESDDSEE